MAEFYRICDEHLDFYPDKYLQTLSDLLGIDMENLILVYPPEEVWELKDYLTDGFLEYQVIVDDFQGVVIGHAQLIMYKHIPIVYEQNASPIGFWMSSENFVKFKELVQWES